MISPREITFSPQLHVFSRVPDILAFLCLDDDRDPGSLLPGILHPDDRVGAFRNRRAGHDPGGFSRSDPLAGNGPGGDVLDNSKTDGRFRGRPAGILRAKGVAVHRRVVLRRDRAPGINILADHPAEGIEDVHLLQAQRGECIQYLVSGLFDADHDLHP